jgi:hypothetical protein
MSENAELLDRFRAGGGRIAELIAGASTAQMDWTPAPGKWTIRQILCHLADTELVAGDRIRRLLAEDNPTLISFDQDAWAANLDYHRRDTTTAVETFRLMRAGHAELLRDLPADAWNRSGSHTERGRVTLLDTMHTHARHVESHASQIESILLAYGQPKAE